MKKGGHSVSPDRYLAQPRLNGLSSGGARFAINLSADWVRFFTGLVMIFGKRGQLYESKLRVRMSIRAVRGMSSKTSTWPMSRGSTKRKRLPCFFLSEAMTANTASGG